MLWLIWSAVPMRRQHPSQFRLYFRCPNQSFDKLSWKLHQYREIFPDKISHGRTWNDFFPEKSLLRLDLKDFFYLKDQFWGPVLSVRSIFCRTFLHTRTSEHIRPCTNTHTHTHNVTLSLWPHWFFCLRRKWQRHWACRPLKTIKIDR